MIHPSFPRSSMRVVLQVVPLTYESFKIAPPPCIHPPFPGLSILFDGRYDIFIPFSPHWHVPWGTRTSNNSTNVSPPALSFCLLSSCILALTPISSSTGQ